MFLTTHYMDEAERCDRIAIIDAGRIVAIDTPNALKASVGADTVTLATADDDAAPPRRSRERLARRGRARRRSARRPRSPTARRSCRRSSRRSTSPVRSVNVRRPSLDDVFIKYTGHEIRDAERREQPQNAMARAHQSR